MRFLGRLPFEKLMKWSRKMFRDHPYRISWNIVSNIHTTDVSRPMSRCLTFWRPMSRCLVKSSTRLELGRNVRPVMYGTIPDKDGEAWNLYDSTFQILELALSHFVLFWEHCGKSTCTSWNNTASILRYNKLQPLFAGVLRCSSGQPFNHILIRLDASQNG